MQPKISSTEISERFGLSRQELIQLADQHTLTVQAWLSSRSPQAAQFSGRGIKASSTGYKVPLLNLALGCNFPPNSSEDEIEAEVRAVINFFSGRNVPWYWWMNTQPAPNNIREILAKLGVEYDAPPLPAMVAPIKQNEQAFPKYDESIRVWRARSIADLKAASQIRGQAFQFPAGEAASYFENMPSDWLNDESPARLFLAGKDESEPMSIGAVIEGAGLPGVYVMATLPGQHRKGYGKSILARLLKEAASMSGQAVVLTASNAGFGLYSQFGFVHLFNFDFYSLPE